MTVLTELRHLLFQYYGVDWIVMLTVFLGVFLLGEKNREGFLLGMTSAFFGVIFSIQIKSVANGIASLALFFLYLRGYLQWIRSVNREDAMELEE
jgi:hypothetical protein